MDRLPFPIGAIWGSAERAEHTGAVHRAVENVLRCLVALVLADTLDLPWNSKWTKDLEGEGKLSNLGLGKRLGLLRNLVHLHGEAPSDRPRVLPPLDEWWKDVASLFDVTIDERNNQEHMVAPGGETAETVRERLREVLRQSRWLREVQLLEVGSSVSKGQLRVGAIQRHMGQDFRHVRHRHVDVGYRGGLWQG